MILGVLRTYRPALPLIAALVGACEQSPDKHETIQEL